MPEDPEVQEAESTEEGGTPATSPEGQGEPEEQVEPQPQQVVVETGEMTEAEKAAQVQSLLSMAESNPTIRNMPEVQDLIKLAGEQKKGEDDTGATEAGGGDGKDGSQKGDGTEPEAGQEGEVTDEVDALVEEMLNQAPAGSEEGDVFGLTQSTEKQDLNIENEEDLKKFIEQQYSIKDYNTLFSSVNGWRNDAQKLADINQKYEAIVDGLASMPEGLKLAVDKWSRAEDWEAAIAESVNRPDFDGTFESQPKEKLLGYYFGDRVDALKTKLNKEEIDEDQYEDRVADLYESTKKLFQNDKKNFEVQRAELLEKNEKLQEDFKSSANGSVDELKKSYPNFSRSDLQSIQARLVNGDLNSIFYNSDGTYKKDAAEKLAFALHGGKLVEKLMAQAKKEGESKAVREHVARSDDQVKDKKNRSASQKQKAADATQHLSTFFTDDPYESVVQMPQGQGAS